MKSSTTAERLQEAMNIRGLKQVDVLKLAEPYCRAYGVNLGKTALTQYVSGKIIPRQDKLTVLGLALDVSEVWLMGYDVPMERKTAPIPTQQAKLPQKQIFLTCIRSDSEEKPFRQWRPYHALR